jgi:hypothetical protein
MNGSKLQLITEIQSDLNQSVDQLLLFASGIQHKTDSSPTQEEDDKDLKELKRFRRRGVAWKLRFLNQPLRLTFDSCSSAASELKDTTSQPHPKGQLSRITENSAIVTRSINQVIKWRISHEFILIQEYWGIIEVSSFDSEISDLTQLINRAMNLPEFEDDDGISSHGRRSLDKHAIPLAQSLIPFLILCRFFFRKLVRIGLNTNPSKSFTDMDSYQLVTLSNSAGFLESNFFDVMNLIAPYEEQFEDALPTTESMDELILRIVDRFDSNLELVITYVIPLITHSISSPNPLASSLLMWNHLFLISARNCIRAADSYEAASQSETHE